jgi:hypothetical protein
LPSLVLESERSKKSHPEYGQTVGVIVAVAVAVCVGLGPGVLVRVTVAVGVTVAVRVGVGVAVLVGVGVEVEVGGGVPVTDGVAVGVAVLVGVAVGLKRVKVVDAVLEISPPSEVLLASRSSVNVPGDVEFTTPLSTNVAVPFLATATGESKRSTPELRLMNEMVCPFSVPVTELVPVSPGMSTVRRVEVDRSHPFEFGTLAVRV